MRHRVTPNDKPDDFDLARKARNDTMLWHWREGMALQWIADCHAMPVKVAAGILRRHIGSGMADPSLLQ